MSRPPCLSQSNRPGRDLTSMSRHQGSQNHVATSYRCRDTVSLAQPQARSPTYVATSISCRDLLDDQPMSRHQVHVVTSILYKPGRDVSSMSRPPCREPPCCHPCRDLTLMSRHQFPLAKPETHCNPARSRRHFLVATSRSTRPGRDLITMSRPQEVLTH